MSNVLTQLLKEIGRGSAREGELLHELTAARTANAERISRLDGLLESGLMGCELLEHSGVVTCEAEEKIAGATPVDIVQSVGSDQRDRQCLKRLATATGVRALRRGEAYTAGELVRLVEYARCGPQSEGRLRLRKGILPLLGILPEYSGPVRLAAALE